MTTARVGSGTISDAHMRDSMHCAERVSDRAVASDNSGSGVGKEDGLCGPWRDCEGEKREGGTGICFRRPKTSDVKLTIMSLKLSVGLSNELRMR